MACGIESHTRSSEQAVVLAEMNAIGFAEQGEVEIVVDDQACVIFVGESAQGDRLFLTVAVGRLLIAVLQNAATGGEDGFRCVQYKRSGMNCPMPGR